MLDYVVHSIVVIMVLADLYSHYTHHRKSKVKRQNSKVYTLEEAKIELFQQHAAQILYLDIQGDSLGIPPSQEYVNGVGTVMPSVPPKGAGGIANPRRKYV